MIQRYHQQACNSNATTTRKKEEVEGTIVKVKRSKTTNKQTETFESKRREETTQHFFLSAKATMQRMYCVEK